MFRLILTFSLPPFLIYSQGHVGLKSFASYDGTESWIFCTFLHGSAKAQPFAVELHRITARIKSNLPDIFSLEVHDCILNEIRSLFREEGWACVKLSIQYLHFFHSIWNFRLISVNFRILSSAAFCFILLFARTCTSFSSRNVKPLA